MRSPVQSRVPLQSVKARYKAFERLPLLSVFLFLRAFAQILHGFPDKQLIINEIARQNYHKFLFFYFLFIAWLFLVIIPRMRLIFYVEYSKSRHLARNIALTDIIKGISYTPVVILFVRYKIK